MATLTQDEIQRKLARLAYLLRVSPKDPQITQLRANLKAAGIDPKTGQPLASQPQTGGPLTVAPGSTLPVQQDPGLPLGDAVGKRGVINPDKAEVIIEDQVGKDVANQFQLDHPMRMTDQYGNVRVIKRNPTTGEVTIQDELGGTAQTFKDLATAAAQTFNGDVSRAKAEEATYGTLTKYYDRDQERELEAAKQEMANRGIPYDPAAAQDPNSKNLYGRTIGGVSEKYRAYKDDAARQAVVAGNQAYATDAAARDSFLQAAMSGASQFSGGWQPYQNSIDTTLADKKMDILALSAEAYMQKYGIDQATYLKEKEIAASNRPSGGGGGGGGFEIIS